MKHAHTIHDHKGEGLKLVGSPEELINMMIEGPHERKWAMEQIIDEGPKHKQVMNALLFMRLGKLVKTIEKSTGKTFELQNGLELINDRDQTIVPVQLPVNMGPGTGKEEIANAISHAPEHEALSIAMCLQVIEWSISAVSGK